MPRGASKARIAYRGFPVRSDFEQQEGLRISCPEEIAFDCKLISAEQLLTAADAIGNTPYGEYLRDVHRLSAGRTATKS
jgi:dTDP-glucose pyrophosphorylase